MITLVLMASGYGKRFGSNKLFYEIDGKAMYLHILEKLHRLSEKKIGGHAVRAVVITQYNEILEKAGQYGMDAVFNPDAAEGIAASVRLGVEAAGKTAASVSLREEVAEETAVPVRSCETAADSEWIVYFTADQPYLESRTIKAFIIAALRSGKTLASVCCGSEPGSPTMFQKCWYPALLKLQGDRGGRRIMKENPREVFWYEISEKEITDIDHRDIVGHNRSCESSQFT